MKKQIFKTFFLLAIFFMLPSFSRAAVIFEDNFDAQAPWLPSCNSCGKNDAGYNNGAELSGTPVDWDYWRNDEYWNPLLPAGATTGSHPTLQISDEQHYGATGKAYVQWNESESDSPNGGSGGWASDGILTKVFSQSYPEIYLQLKIKFQPGFQWTWTPSNAGVIKVLRFSHYDIGTGSPYYFFSSGTNAPFYIYDISTKESPYNTRDAHTVRCDPQATNWTCNQSFDMASSIFGQGIAVSGSAWNTIIGDGNWHILTWRAKLNSAPGAADGILQMWYDGTLRLSHTNVDWIGTGGDLAVGWNTFSLGGNTFNNWLGINDAVFQSGAEQWYAIDDVVVSTTAIPDGYVIGSDTLAPSAPTGLGVM